MNLSSITFGQVPSRRLGCSLGINNIPPKVSSYSCVYCQVGRMDTPQNTRQPFYDLTTILTKVEKKKDKVIDLRESIDFLTFVSDGEPTLESNLGKTIDLLRPPAESRIHPPAEDTFAMAYQIVKTKVENVECLFDYEGNAFSLTGNVKEDLLNILVVHPMQEEAVRHFLAKAGTDWALIYDLMVSGDLLATCYAGKWFYQKKLTGS